MISRPLNETPEERDELASEYVLGTLPAELRVQVRLRLEDDAELRTAVDSWERRLLGLTDLVEPVLPSTQLWPRIERSVQVLEPKPRSPAPRAASWWNLLPLWRGLAGAGQFLQRAGGAMHEVADAVDVEDDGVLAIAVDDALELADHAAPIWLPPPRRRPPSWCRRRS